MKKVWIITLGFLMGNITGTAGQDLERILWDNPWQNGLASAGMAFSDRNYSDISLLAGYRGGEFRNIYDPAASYLYGMQTRSYRKLGKTTLSGTFSYSYEDRKVQRWLGILDPYRTPFMLADSVAGNYVLESYHMDAGMAYPVSGKWTLGCRISYDARNGAKYRDLRNSDTYMDFMVAPSVVYENGPARIGAHLYFRRITEQIDYTQVETSTNKVLFSFSGMWFNTQQVYTSSAPGTRLLRDHLYGGGITLHYRPGRFSLFDHFSAGIRNQTQREDVVLARRYGDVSEWSWQNTLMLYYTNRHRIKADVSWTGQRGFQPVQRQELNQTSRLWEWVQYGTIPSFVQERTFMDISYSYRIAQDEHYDRWRVTAGISRALFSQQWIKYPLAVQRSLELTQAYALVSRSWFVRRWIIDLSPGISYVAGQLEETTPEELLEAQILHNIGFENPEDFRLWEPAGVENDFMTGKRIAAGIKIRVTFFANPSKGLNLFAETGYRYTRRLSGNNKMFHEAGLNIGVIF
ncbi:MAG: hypothetical protein GX474_06020 [Bacteroidales bacterium]|nr:hypothetical protein [Bacteroidales bacterium]